MQRTVDESQLLACYLNKYHHEEYTVVEFSGKIIITDFDSYQEAAEYFDSLENKPGIAEFWFGGDMLRRKM